MATRTSAGRKAVVVLFEGGGALGAYAAGVWQVLGPRLARRGLAPTALAGSSVGAINAALLARHADEPDLGAAALLRFWREEIATASLPFTGSGRLDGLMTSLLVGNSAFHRGEPLHWNPLAGLARAHVPLLDRRRMAQWLHERIGRVDTAAGGSAPWLGAVATDVMAGRLHVFDSDAGGVGAPELMASSAIPFLYEPVTLDGTLYWDGDLIRDSMLAPVLARLRACGRVGAREVPLVVTVSLRPLAAAKQPVSGLELSWRLLELLMHGKLDADEARHAGVPEAVIIRRGSLAGDAQSRELDYSPARVDELVRQGEREADAALAGTPLAG